MHSIRNGIWVAGGIATNPSNGDILVTTGAVKGGDYLFAFNIHASADAVVTLVQRNSTDDADKASYDIKVPADQDVSFYIPLHIGVLQNERLLLRMKGGITGTIQGSIFYGTVIG